MNILVTGGCGFIGSHAVLKLLDSGYNVIIVDNLSRASINSYRLFRDIVRVCDLRDFSSLYEIFRTDNISAVMHFAGFAYVGESVNMPLEYYDNNFNGTYNLLRCMAMSGVDKLIFSSTCATYGLPRTLPITETTLQLPVSPYGSSKLACERLINDVSAVTNIRTLIFRYFNAAGSDPLKRVGEDHYPETHLIPNLINSIIFDQPFTVYGNNYNTVDGTAIRDFVHVIDIVEAHFLGLQYLNNNSGCTINLGTGRGYSINEIISVAEKLFSKKIRVLYENRRVGDPDSLYCDNTVAYDRLNWVPKNSDMTKILTDTYNWLVHD